VDGDWRSGGGGGGGGGGGRVGGGGGRGGEGKSIYNNDSLQYLHGPGELYITFY
jgi:hypothetical protein